MNELIQFLTSKDIIIVYCISFLACLLCFVIYIVEKNSDNYKKKHNTRELNKLVAQIKDKFVEAEPIESMEEPVLEINDNQASAVNDMLESTLQLDSIEKLEDVEEDEEPFIIEDIDIVKDVYEEIVEEPELEYTSIEPDRETAQLELKKITEELRKNAEIEATGELSLTNFEEQQEENAIISLEELLKRGKDIYRENELTQYVDENTMPISLQELEIQSGNTAKVYDEPFLIENVISKEEKAEVEQEIMKEENRNLNEIDSVESRFKNSPIISQVFGIEKKSELELENTANFEKFDKELNRNNEFLMTFKELQNKLE